MGLITFGPVFALGLLAEARGNWRNQVDTCQEVDRRVKARVWDYLPLDPSFTFGLVFALGLLAEARGNWRNLSLYLPRGSSKSEGGSLGLFTFGPVFVLRGLA